jgi:hypothetical protein
MQQLLRRLKGYRTVIFHAALGLPALTLVVLDYLKTVDMTQLASTKTAMTIGIGINIGGIVLRYVTTTPIGDNNDRRDPQ